jgi:hypothetical protein
MRLKEIVAEDGRIFLKSEWGPMSDHWPALSFSKRSVGDRLRQEFNPDRDAIIYVGTGDPKSTGAPEHHRRLLSVVKAEPNTIHETRMLVPAASWAEAQRDYRGRWEHSLTIRYAWDIVGFPLAPTVIPKSYRLLGKLENLGNVVEVDETERDGLLGLEVIAIDLQLQEAATAFDDKRGVLSLDVSIRKEIGRIAAILIERAKRGGTETVRVNPARLVDSDIQILLGKKWQEQKGCCLLCGGALVISGSNKLLQASADRIDSSLPSYNSKNLHITHLGCNLAKNDVTMEEFAEWLAVLRKGEVAKTATAPQMV